MEPRLRISSICFELNFEIPMDLTRPRSFSMPSQVATGWRVSSKMMSHSWGLDFPLSGRRLAVNQEEVDVVKAEVLQGLQDGCLHVVGFVFVVPNLAGHEDLLPGQS